MSVLEMLVSPHSAGEFLDEYYNRKAVYLEGEESRFSGLFGWDEINQVLNFGRPGLQNVTLIMEKRKQDAASVADVMSELIKGATLNINAINDINPDVAALADALGAELNSRVNVNCYASYPSKQGFDNHYDGHDVFVVHTAGRKSWKVFPPTLEAMAHDRDKRREPPPDSEPYLEADLTPGDVLYIPRGHWHYAVASTPSVHITVGISPRTAADYLAWLSQRALDNDKFLRKEIPVARIEALGGDQSDEYFNAYLDALAERMQEIMGNRAVLKESVIQFLMHDNGLRRSYQLPETSLIPVEITPDTRLALRPGQKYLVRYDPDTGSGLLLFRGQHIVLKSVPEGVVEQFLEAAPRSVTGRQLMAASPGTEWAPVRQMLVNLTVGGLLQVEEGGRTASLEKD